MVGGCECISQYYCDPYGEPFPSYLEDPLPSPGTSVPSNEYEVTDPTYRSSMFFNRNVTADFSPIQ